MYIYVNKIAKEIQRGRYIMGKAIEYYLSKGFERKMAEYFSNGRKIIVSVIANDDYTLTLGFDNGEKRIYDVAPLIEPGTIFEILLDLNNFRRVYIDDEHCIAWDIDSNVDSNMVWNNKIDLSPDSCYVDSIQVK